MRALCLMAGLLLTAPAGAQSVKSGIEAWRRSDYAAALAAWQPLAAKGNPDAMFNLGQAYRLGRGVPTDVTRAQNWYHRAARAGHVEAQAQLGMSLFQLGNQAAGLRWLKTAADKGEPRAQLLYGTALFNGDGVARDMCVAHQFVSRSAAQGLAPAKIVLLQIEEAMSPDLRRTSLAGASSLPVRPPASPPANSLNTSVPSATLPLAAPASGEWRVQLGAFSQKVSAENLFQKYADVLLAGRDSFFIPVGAITRLQAGPFSSRADAANTCAALTGHGQACFVVRGPR